MFLLGLTQSFIMIFLAEIGDRTFFLVTLISARMNKLLVFLVASLGMVLMHILSVCIGAIFPLLLPKSLISFVVIALFLGFGLHMLWNAFWPSPNHEDAKEEAEEAMEKIEETSLRQEPLLGETQRDTRTTAIKREKFWENSKWTAFMFILMCTEWGDMSQIAAIGLAAKYGMLSIIIGGGVAHILTIFIAILLGVIVSKYCNEKWLHVFSGVLFISFGIREALELYYGE